MSIIATPVPQMPKQIRIDSTTAQTVSGRGKIDDELNRIPIPATFIRQRYCMSIGTDHLKGHPLRRSQDAID